jgi:hypothetical protein
MAQSAPADRADPVDVAHGDESAAWDLVCMSLPTIEI